MEKSIILFFKNKFHNKTKNEFLMDIEIMYIKIKIIVKGIINYRWLLGFLNNSILTNE